jgi:hypothetical protein
VTIPFKAIMSAVLMFGLTLSTAVAAQDRQGAGGPTPAPSPDRAPARAAYDGPIVPLRVQLVISRYDGDKKISSQPYTLSVNAGRPVGVPPIPVHVARLRMGAEVPVSNVVAASPDAKAASAGGPVQYKAIGTNIDCFAFIQDDARYRLEITIEDSSVYASDRVVPGTVASRTTPVFRSFKLTNEVILEDGQSSQFTAATDKISGELVKVDVTMNVAR